MAPRYELKRPQGRWEALKSRGVEGGPVTRTRHPERNLASPTPPAALQEVQKPRLSEHLYNRRRLPGEVVTRSAAIQNFCRECLGWNSGGLGSLAENIRSCDCQECWLWPWRNGGLDDTAKQG
jgi:hypothetical protein